jgi:hypothetical protein
MKNYLLIGLVSIFLLFSQNKVKASHYAGGEITYTCLGGYSYLITYTFYRDCSGVPAPQSISINFECSSNISINFASTLNKVTGTGQEITPSCPTAPTYCSGGNSLGIQEYVYQAQVTLPACNYWTMHTSSCCRNPATTITSNTSNGWYAFASLDNLNAPGNSSPVFNNKPIIIAFNNQKLVYNHGVSEADGDSLVFSLMAPLTNSLTNSITYASPYSYTNFLSSSIPITLDTATGQIVFKPNQTLTTVTGVKVEEWRKVNGTPTLIGWVYRDLQLTVINSNNHYPVLSGFISNGSHLFNPNDTIYNISKSVLDTIDLNIAGFDADSANGSAGGDAEQFSLSWNQGIAQGTFTAYNNHSDSAWANFHWIPNINNISTLPHCFSVIVRDYACPYGGKQIYTYCITITPPAPLFLGKDTSILDNQILILDGGAGNFSYAWSTGDNTRFLTVDGSKLNPGAHTISLTRTGYGVSQSDTIIVEVQSTVGLENQTNNFSISVHPNPGDGIFVLDIENPQSKRVELNVYNSIGAMVYHDEFSVHTPEIQKQVDISDLSKGVYVLKIRNGNKELIKKIIIR